MIRKAKISDAEHIYKLISTFAKSGVMLARSLNSIYENIRDFWVAVDPEGEKVIGCCALHIIGWEGLAEIRSLTVDSSYQHHGTGRELVMQCIKEAKEMELKKLFALTFVPDFFFKCGFREESKDKLPHKIWSDCIDCPFFPNCTEVAVIMEIA